MFIVDGTYDPIVIIWRCTFITQATHFSATNITSADIDFQGGGIIISASTTTDSCLSDIITDQESLVFFFDQKTITEEAPPTDELQAIFDLKSAILKKREGGGAVE